MNLQTFRYAVCGGSNVLLSFISFTVLYHFVLDQQVLDLGFFAFESYSVALVGSSLLSFFIGFWLNKYVVFVDSNLKGRVQLFRYLLSYISNLFLNYVFLKSLVEYFGMYPVLAQVLVTAVIILISYLTQRYYTFRVRKH